MSLIINMFLINYGGNSLCKTSVMEFILKILKHEKLKEIFYLLTFVVCFFKLNFYIYISDFSQEHDYLTECLTSNFKYRMYLNCSIQKTRYVYLWKKIPNSFPALPACFDDMRVRPGCKTCWD